MKWNPFPKKPVDISKQKTDLNDVRAAPVDPTLEAAARETAERILEKARNISQLSNDITSMTDDFLRQFKATNDVQRPDHK